MILQGKYFRAKISQILSHQVQSRNLLLQNIDNLITRRLDPLPFNGSRTGSRNLPVCVKCTEMVNTDNIKKFITISDPVCPELIALLFHMLPIIDWISPSLSYCAEIIRWYPCNKNRTSICVQKEIILSAPHIHRVLSHIERNISHNLDSCFIGSFLYFHPLGIENILKEHLVSCFCLCLCIQYVSVLRPGTVFLWPFIPAGSVVCFL